MTGNDRSVGEHVAWNGTSPAVSEIRGLLVPHAPVGTLRLVLQRLCLHEQGRPVGEHQVIDAITDVSGNLVAMPLGELVRADPATSAALDGAIARLRSDLDADGATGADGLEVVLDADGEHRVLVTFALDVTREEVRERPRHPAVHDGNHHITHDAPTLDELRDRIAAPAAGPLRRLAGALRRLWNSAGTPGQ